jgi:hypothetical protein
MMIRVPASNRKKYWSNFVQNFSTYIRIYTVYPLSNRVFLKKLCLLIWKFITWGLELNYLQVRPFYWTGYRRALACSGQFGWTSVHGGQRGLPHFGRDAGRRRRDVPEMSSHDVRLVSFSPTIIIDDNTKKDRPFCIREFFFCIWEMVLFFWVVNYGIMKFILGRRARKCRRIILRC